MARKKEQRAYDSFKAGADPRNLKMHRIENLIGNGMSDVLLQNRKGGTAWIENKALDEWPKRDSTKPLANIFEPGQLPFLREWIEWGGHGYVLLRAEMEYYLLDPVDNLRAMTTAEVKAAAMATGKKDIYKLLEGIV